MKSYEERTKDNAYKIASFQVKQKQPYEFKLRYAELQVREFSARRRAGGYNIHADYEQAERVAWRIVKDWVEVQMAILESEMVQMDEIFLPYMTDKTGQTLFDAYRSGQLLLE